MRIQATNKNDYYGVMGFLYCIALNPRAGTGALMVEFDKPVIDNQEDQEDWEENLTELKRMFPSCDWKRSFTLVM